MIKTLSLFSGIGGFEKAQNFNSNTQLYKQAGNSVCVNVIEELYKNLLN